MISSDRPLTTSAARSVPLAWSGDVIASDVETLEAAIRPAIELSGHQPQIAPVIFLHSRGGRHQQGFDGALVQFFIPDPQISEVVATAAKYETNALIASIRVDFRGEITIGMDRSKFKILFSPKSPKMLLDQYSH